jgi:hypothetical protein
MKSFRSILPFVATAFILIGSVALYDYVVTSRARSRAAEFCDELGLNTSIAGALTRAKREEISYISQDWYSFYFPAAFFDTAICEVKTDAQGLVKSKSVWISRD